MSRNEAKKRKTATGQEAASNGAESIKGHREERCRVSPIAQLPQSFTAPCYLTLARAPVSNRPSPPPEMERTRHREVTVEKHGTCVNNLSRRRGLCKIVATQNAGGPAAMTPVTRKRTDDVLQDVQGMFGKARPLRSVRIHSSPIPTRTEPIASRVLYQFGGAHECRGYLLAVKSAVLNEDFAGVIAADYNAGQINARHIAF